jgi:signal transduction histidine kinase
LADPLRLRRRLGLQGAAFGLLLLSAFAATLYFGIAAERRQNLRAEAAQLAAAAASQLPLISHEVQEVGNARKFRNDREVVTLVSRRRQRVQWLDAAGRLLLEEGQLTLPAGGTAGPWQQWPGGISLRQPVYTRQRHGQAEPPRLAGYVRVALSTGPLEQELARLRRGLLLGGITAVIVALMVGRRLLRQAFLPLQRQVEALERFSAEASHELRHPLTLLRTLVASQPAPLSPLLQRIDAIAAGMGDLLNDLLFLARQEQGRPGGGWRRFDLLELLEDQLASCTPLASQAQLELVLHAEPAAEELPVWGQPEQLQRLFSNLLLNALRFAPSGSVVQVTARQQAGRLHISVADQGPGIVPAHRQAVFERFWTLESAGAGPGGHSGLGLSIARAIARRHGGELSLAAAEPGHCVFQVDLPAA